MAGFFGFFDYTKPGPGVNKNEVEKKSFFLFFDLYFRKFGKLVSLNLIYTLCCIPIITIGPMTAGLTYVMRYFVTEKPCFPISDMFEKAWENKWQSLWYSIISAVVMGCNLYAIYFYVIQPEKKLWIYAAISLSCLCFVFLSFMSYYMYLLIVTVQLKLFQMFKNAFIFAVLGFVQNICTFFFVGIIMALVIWYFPMSLLFMIVIGFATIRFIICFNSYKIVKRYIIDPFYEKQEGAQDDSKEEKVFSDRLLDEE